MLLLAAIVVMPVMVMTVFAMVVLMAMMSLTMMDVFRCGGIYLCWRGGTCGGSRLCWCGIGHTVLAPSFWRMRQWRSPLHAFGAAPLRAEIHRGYCAAKTAASLIHSST
jgi:hypothetical protein